MIKHNAPIDIAVATTRKAVKWQNKRSTWADIVATLRETERTSETIKRYFYLTKDRQDEIKDVGGFVGGYLKEGRRKKEYVDYRQIVTLDVDYGGLDAWDAFTLLDAAGVMYTTHKHTPEVPRFRIVFPLDRKVSPDEYEAVARVVASWLGIDNFDDTTYQPHRLMYYPSTAKDGEYLFDFVDAPFIVADEVLAELPDWKDPTTWPVSSRVKEAVRDQRADKVEDPLEKEGLIGAFCRAFPMYDALAEFLSDVYTPCEEMGHDRYTFVSGSTSGGLVVYDNKLAYSHHATDVAGGKLCNAFDLVRLHKFGDLDEKAKPETEPAKLPSCKAMSEFVSKLKEVKREIIRERRSEANDYDELEGNARAAAENEDWVDELTMIGKTNLVENTIENAYLIINNDSNLKERLQLDLHANRDEVVKPFTWDKYTMSYPRALDDSDINQILQYIEKAYGITQEKKIITAMKNTAYNHGYHPVRDYLDALPKWDGVERLDALLVELFKAQDSEYVRAVTRKTFCAAIARIYRPGIKFDYMLTLIGEGGNGKSTFLSRMGGQWFSDNVKITSDKKENLSIMRGKWILEIAEMRGFGKVEAEFSKQFISRQKDEYRRPYDRLDTDFPRQCIFVGTHNKSDFLHDETGNRRFWPVQTHSGREDGRKVWNFLTTEVVGQIWAEAKHRWDEGEELFLSPDLEKRASVIQDEHRETDAWEEDILTYVQDKDEVTTKEIWELAMLGDRPISKMDSNRIGKIMRFNGWEQVTVRRSTFAVRAWQKKM